MWPVPASPAAAILAPTNPMQEGIILSTDYDKLIKRLLNDPLWDELQNKHRQLLEDGWAAIDQQLTTQFEDAVNRDNRLQPIHRRQLLDEW
jgi:hypothetical protein